MCSYLAISECLHVIDGRGAIREKKRQQRG
jgi:hypothetical protein